MAVSTALHAAPPNILFIVSEDNGPELGCYGDPYVQTPHLDRLASEGVRFTRAYVTQAGCSQSRASIMTGLYPHQHGQIGLATWGFRMYRPDTANLVQALKAAGYRTGIIGKLHINPESAFPFDFSAIPSGNFARKNLGEYAKNAEAFFTAAEAPFFLSVNYPEAHRPWVKQVDGLPAKPLEAADVTSLAYFGVDEPGLRALVADYYNCLSRLDSLVGELLAALQRSGKAANTFVVYLGDHGADMLRGKRTSYEGGVRIPLIVRWPAQGRPAQVREELVSTIDLMPTALALSGATAVSELPGHSLLPLVRGERPAWRRYLFTEFHTHAALENFYPQRTVRDALYKLIENLLPGETNRGYAFTMGHLEADLAGAVAAAAPEIRRAYERMRTPPRFELYDLQADPYEFRDLTADPAHARTLAELQRELAAWRATTGDPLLNPENLSRLKAEMVAMTTKSSGKHGWQYPSYFFEKDAGSPAPADGSRPRERASDRRKDRPK